jgi:hypothetical protein
MLTRTLEALTALNPRTVTSGPTAGNNPGQTPAGPAGGATPGTTNPGGPVNTGRARHGGTSELIAGFLYRSPVPCLVARYFRDVPMLSHAFVALAQTSLRVLGTCRQQETQKSGRGRKLLEVHRIVLGSLHPPTPHLPK